MHRRNPEMPNLCEHENTTYIIHLNEKYLQIFFENWTHSKKKTERCIASTFTLSIQLELRRILADFPLSS